MTALLYDCPHVQVYLGADACWMQMWEKAPAGADASFLDTLWRALEEARALLHEQPQCLTLVSSCLWVGK